MSTHDHGLATPMIERSHTGRLRARNEDACVVEPAEGLAILADGMGGLAAGDVASRAAVEGLRRVLLRRAARHPDVLARAIRQVDKKLQQLAQDEGGPGSMGTTLVVWQRSASNTALIAHVGDSRCYREHRGKLSQLTRDHSIVQMQVDAGLISETAAFSAPNRHLITQALGLGEPLSIDVIESPVTTGDRFLLCSDGLTDMVSPVALAELFQTHTNPHQLADALLDAAMTAGGRDNISLILIGI